MSLSKKHIIINVDAACDNQRARIMGIGVHCIFDDMRIELTRNYGLGTNNIGEWMAMCLGLRTAVKILNHLKGNNLQTSFEIRSDSKIVVEQLNGRFEVKQETFKPYYALAKSLILQLDACDVIWIPREENKKADILSKVGLLVEKSEFSFK